MEPAGNWVIVTGDAALAAAKVLNGPIATSSFRAKWVIAGTSYTFSLIACLDRDETGVRNKDVNNNQDAVSGMNLCQTL
jgi:hypothetical protein